jgi:hypothetical protein
VVCGGGAGGRAGAAAAGGAGGGGGGAAGAVVLGAHATPIVKPMASVYPIRVVRFISASPIARSRDPASVIVYLISASICFITSISVVWSANTSDANL